MNALSQRFHECIKALCAQEKVRSLRQFALSLDYLPENFVNILPLLHDSHDLVHKACKMYNIRMPYLLTGEGDMFNEEKSAKEFRVLTIVTDKQNEERIVHVPIPAQAGYVSDMADSTFYSELPTYSLPDYRFSQGTHRSFDVSGDSMEPRLADGDTVVCSFIEPSQWLHGIKDDHIYVIATNTDVIVKRVNNELRKNRSLYCISDNDSYRPFHLAAESIREIWFVRLRIAAFNHGKYTSPLEQILQHQDETIHEQQEMIRFLKQTIEKFSPMSNTMG
ncbi:MAG: S24 family peptidase [Saprospiraceae bacterium]